MQYDPPSRTYYSPVVFWTSKWQGGILVGTKNKESRSYQKALDAEYARQVNSRNKK